MSDYEVVFCVVNAGYSELVMDAAKEVGARGGTVIHARGTANKEAEKFFSITIQPDKEIVMILVPSKIKDDVLHAIYRQAGLKSAGQGIAFTLAVDEVVGIAAPAQETPAPQPEKTTPAMQSANVAPARHSERSEESPSQPENKNE
ncbi:MAG: P-II family nitrogen regulator [Clostridia bacterium]|nr:P-II family nitrogen regulator [Clostridia bacterium]